MTRVPNLALAFVLCAGLAAAQPGAAPRGDGGFRVGDRVYVWVDSEKALTDTFTVSVGPAIIFPVIGSVPLDGVKRLEVQKRLADYIGRFVRDPVVRARAIIRVGISGEVTKPGFFPVPVDVPVAEALMIAGGPTKDARLDKITVTRNGSTLYTADSLHAATKRGATLAELDLQNSDEVVVGRSTDFERTLRVVGYVMTIPLAIFAIIQTTKKK